VIGYNVFIGVRQSTILSRFRYVQWRAFQHQYTKSGDPFNIKMPTIKICKQLVHVQKIVLTINNYQELLFQNLKVWGGIEPRSFQILPIVAQVRFAQITHVKTFPAIPR